MAVTTRVDPARAPVRADQFVDTIGVNTHLSWVNTAYWDLDRVRASLDYLGVDNVRDVITPWSADRVDALIKDGVAFCFIIGTHDLAYQKQAIEARAKAIDYIEGPNEIDNWPVTFDGKTGLQGGVALMAHLRQWIDQSPVLGPKGADLPLVQLSFGHTNQFTLPVDLTPYADIANAHSYAPWGWNPSRVLQDRIDGARAIAPVERVVSTEAGYHTATNQTGWTGVSEAVQARYTLNLLFEQHRHGVEKTYLYNLMDFRADATARDPERNFGLFHADGTPRLAAEAIHRTTSLLTVEGAFKLQPLAYGIDGLPATGGHLLMQTAPQRYVLAVWNDVMQWDEKAGRAIDPAAVPIAIDLPDAVSKLTVHDPITGTIRAGTRDGEGMLALKLPAHPLLVEIETAARAAAPAPGPTAPEPASPAPKTAPEAVAGPPASAANLPLIQGTAGDDRLYGTDRAERLIGGAGNDLLAGRGGDDYLNGGPGHDRVLGGAGDDWLVGGPGRDHLDGGSGRDTVDYSAFREALRIDLDPKAGFAVTAARGRDAVRWVEDAIGGAGDDVITGHLGANRLVGGPGRDALRGAGGDDVLVGGAGRDLFVFDWSARGAARIEDYAPGDAIWILSAPRGPTARVVSEGVVLEMGRGSVLVKDASALADLDLKVSASTAPWAALLAAGPFAELA